MSVKKVNKTTGTTTKVAGLVNSEKVNTMYGAFPSDASASNKLVSDATADDKISDESQVIFEVMGEMGAKNLLPVTVAEIKKNNTSNGEWNGNVFTTTGGKITFTINTTDGVTVDSIRVQTNPSGTGVSAYSLYVFDGSKKIATATIYTPISDNDAVSPPFSCGCIVNGTSYAVNNGAKYKDLPAGTLTKSWIYSESGSTVDKTFYPMIRLASIEDDTYEPYAKTNQELTKDTTGLIDNDFANGAVNLLPLIKYTNRQFGDATNGYITVNSNADGSYTLNGSRISTAPVLLIQIIKDGKYLLTDNILKKGESYKYTACPSNSASQHLLSQINYRDGSNNLVQYEEGGNGVTINIPIDATVGNCNIAVYHDANFSNVVVKPMITLASTPNSDYNHYVPYTMTNQQLTSDKVGMGLLAVGGAVNLFNNDSTADNTTGGVHFVTDANTKITTASTDSSGATAQVYHVISTQTLPAGTYRFSGCPQGGGFNSYWINYIINNTNYNDLGDGFIFSSNSEFTVGARLYVKTGTVLTTPIQYKPMIAHIEYTGDYAPYAKSNKELTDVMALFSNAISREITPSTSWAVLENMGTYVMDGVPFTGNWSIVLVLKRNENTGVQIAFRVGNSSDVSSNYVAYRIYYTGYWSNWAVVNATNMT